MASTLLLRDLDELRAARKHFGERLEDLQIYTLRPQLYLQLTKEGVHPNIFSQHISAREAYDIYRQAYVEITGIVDSFPESEGSLQINLARYFKVFYWEYLADVYAFDLAINRILDHSSRGRFAYFQRAISAPGRHAELANIDLISSQMLTALGRQRPSTVQPLPTDDKGNVAERLARWGKSRRQLHSVEQVAVRLVRFIRLMTIRPRPAVVPEERAIAFGSGYDALIVIPDALRLGREKGLRPLWMTEWVDKATTRSGLSYRDEYDRVERFSTSQYQAQHPISPLTKSEITQVDEHFEKFMSRLSQIDVMARYGLTDALSGLRQEFRNALLQTKVMNRVLECFAGSTVIVTNYNGVQERAIEQLAPRHQIEVVARPHGWISNIEGYEYEATRYLVSGDLWRELVKDFYGESTPVYASPDPSLVDVANQWLGKTTDEQEQIIREKRGALSIRAQYVVLIMTTAARKHILNEFDYPALQDFWRHTFEYLGDHPDVHVVLKSHKNNFDWWVADHGAQRVPTNLTILNGRLEDAVKLADLVVDLGKPGSATLVSLLFRKPTLLYRDLYKYVRELGDLTYEAAAPFVVNGPGALIAEFEKLRGEGRTYLSTLRSSNHELLERLVTL